MTRGRLPRDEATTNSESDLGLVLLVSRGDGKLGCANKCERTVLCLTTENYQISLNM